MDNEPMFSTERDLHLSKDMDMSVKGNGNCIFQRKEKLCLSLKKGLMFLKGKEIYICQGTCDLCLSREMRLTSVKENGTYIGQGTCDLCLSREMGLISVKGNGTYVCQGKWDLHLSREMGLTSVKGNGTKVLSLKRNITYVCQGKWDLYANMSNTLPIIIYHTQHIKWFALYDMVTTIICMSVYIQAKEIRNYLMKKRTVNMRSQNKNPNGIPGKLIGRLSLLFTSLDHALILWVS